MLETTLEKPKTKGKGKTAFNIPRQGEWTREHWQNFPNDGWKYEIIDGVLYMSPATDCTSTRFYRIGCQDVYFCR